MKAKSVSKVKVTLSNRKPWGRLDESTKQKIVSEIRGGLLSQRAAGRKYGLPKNTITKWQDKHKFKRQNYLRKIDELNRALADVQLKNIALETMIEVTESELKILF